MRRIQTPFSAQDNTRSAQTFRRRACHIGQSAALVGANVGEQLGADIESAWRLAQPSEFGIIGL